MTFFCVACASLCSGYLAGIDTATSRDRWEPLFATAATLFLARQCCSAYQYFTKQFAMAIYRDFSTYEKAKGDGGGKE
jgi:hypothetical protein